MILFERMNELCKSTVTKEIVLAEAKESVLLNPPFYFLHTKEGPHYL